MSGYRSRPRKPNPFGGIDPATYGTLDEAIARAIIDRSAQLDPVIERRVSGVGWVEHHPEVSVEDLARLGLAKPVTSKSFNPIKAKVVASTAWHISEDGYRALRDAASADPLTFDLETYRPEEAS